MDIAIAGTGYVGLVTAVCLAEKGHRVTCVDIDNKKIEMMRKGVPPIYEENLAYLMNKNKSRITYTSDYKYAYENAKVIFIGVGTPEKNDGSVNLDYIWQVVNDIVNSVNDKRVVVIKSTVPIGINDEIEKYLNKNKRPNAEFYIVSNPEFLSQGTAIKDTLNASRIIIGSNNQYATDVMLDIYDKFDVPKMVTSRRSAEMIKYASNDFLALKISYINEIANLCELVNADINEVALGMGLDARIGSKFLNAGVGYGGSCFPKDTKALNWISSIYNIELKTIRAAIDVNEKQKLILLEKSKKYYKSLKNLKVAVLGLTFKPNTDDLREAPSLVNIPVFIEEGARVYAYDPIGCNNYMKLYPDGIVYCQNICEALEGADICFIFTEWDEIKQLTWKEFSLMKTPIILDGRNCYDTKEMDEYPLIYDSVGRCLVKNI